MFCILYRKSENHDPHVFGPHATYEDAENELVKLPVAATLGIGGYRYIHRLEVVNVKRLAKETL